MTFSTIDILAILGVILFGIPHGALDWELVKHGDSHPRLVRFVCFYLGSTAVGVILWITVPTATLLLFLLITAIHFGRADPFKLSVSDVHNNFLKNSEYSISRRCRFRFFALGSLDNRRATFYYS